MKREEVYLVFDTETTGLPPSKRPLTDSDGWQSCRVVELAWHLYDRDGKLLSEHSYIVRPDGFTIPDRVAAIHGITTDKALQEGSDIHEVMELFYNDLTKCTTLVAHNIRFDTLVVLSELHRYKKNDMIDEFNKKTQRCTMLMGKPPKGRWLKLAVLYSNLFGEAPQGTLHRAACDVDICAKCFFRMI